MNKTFSGMPLFIVTILLVSIGAYGIQDSQWAGTASIEKGVKIVKNPAEPLRGEIKLDLREDLSIGDENKEETLYADLLDFAVDGEENIFVVDGENCRIQKFDRTGKLLFAFGSKGQGPGELQRPYRIYYSSREHIFVNDMSNPAWLEYDHNGKFIKNIRFPHTVLFLCVLEDDNVLVPSYIESNHKLRQTLSIFSPDGKRLKSLVEFPVFELPKPKGQSIGSAFLPGLVFSASPEGEATFGFSSEYKVFRTDDLGNIVLGMEIDEPPQPVTTKDRKAFVENFLASQDKRSFGPKLNREDVEKAAAAFPANKPRFQNFLTDGRGNTYVLRYPGDNPGIVYDVFNKDGHFIYKFKTDFTVYAVRGDHVYRTLRNPDTGYRRIQRLKIMNWNQIKWN
ncbi:MAG: 6-bladed beta-propeller [Candidatus Aminicenantales bacterium]